MNHNGKLQIHHSKLNEHEHTISLTGDLDIKTAPRLRKFVEKMIRQGAVNLTLDLRNLSYLDSSGYGAIVDMTRKARATQGRIDFANMPTWMNEFFDLSILETTSQPE